MFVFEACVLIVWLARVFASQPIRTRTSKSNIFVFMLRWPIFLTASILCRRGCSKITDFFADGVTGSLYIREHCCKVSAKNIDRYPLANAILCLHLNNSTLRSNTWLSPTRFLKLNDCFQLFYDKLNKLLRHGEFSILL